MVELTRKTRLEAQRRMHLEQCEQHVAFGNQHIAGQRELIEQLDRDGLDSAWARDLLIVLRGINRCISSTATISARY